MSIQQFRTKIKNKRTGESERAKETLVFALIVALVGIGSFGVGMLAERFRVATGTAIEEDTRVLVTSDVTLFDQGGGGSSAGTVSVSGSYFASRNGTSYYPLNCTAGDRILPENKIYFKSMSEAETAGFKQSASCSF